MPRIAEDRVLETTTTTGTGALTLAGAVTGFRAFSAVMTSPSDTCYYVIEAVDGSGVPTGEWETGLGTYSAANTLTRTTVLESSNSGSVVTLSAGTKRVFMGGLANAALGFDATQAAPNFYGNGQLGTIPKVIACGTGTESKTNSTTSDQDFTALYNLPANALFTNKCYRVTVCVEVATGSSTAQLGGYLKLGSTKVAVNTTNSDWINSVTQTATWQFLIFGRAAPSASSNVTVGFPTLFISNGNPNNLNMPIAVATDGALDIILGIVYSATGSTETVQLQAWLVEELN
jgi:hypothetical protein